MWANMRREIGRGGYSDNLVEKYANKAILEAERLPKSISAIS